MPVKVSEVLDFTGFDCGVCSINEYIHKQARNAPARKAGFIGDSGATRARSVG